MSWPRHPGHSGGEIRDFHLLRHLLSISRVTAYSLYMPEADPRKDLLAPHLEALHTSDSIRASRGDLVDAAALRIPRWKRSLSELQRRGWPILGPAFHADVRGFIPGLQCYLGAAVREHLAQEAPDFLFVSPQVNALGLYLRDVPRGTRLILASYDVEAVRMRRLGGVHQSWLARTAGWLESRRARRFERDNLACYDGIVAVSELDKQLFVELYDYPAERVLVVPNCIDPVYFSFRDRLQRDDKPILFTGSLNYPPNHQAALRLIDRILPLVRRRHPEATAWIVGQNPGPEVRARHDGKQTVVTGKVPDVRPYLAAAAVACVPLLAGSGTKYKVLEGLAAGMPLVCSPLALEGLELEDGKHLLAGESDEDLAAALVRLLDDPPLGARLARAGRQQVARLYCWDRNLSVLDGWLESLARMDSYRHDRTRAVPTKRYPGASLIARAA
jgi:glycosyltransferase involved in cell wall biosynthesis